MTHIHPVKGPWHQMLLLGLLAASMLINSCDDYNIVEPRFYSEDDVYDIADCGYDPFAELAANLDSAGNSVRPKRIPSNYAAYACWFDRTEGILAVGIALPVGTDYTVSLLDSGGGVKAIIHEGTEPAGEYVFPCVVDDTGIYALSLQADRATVVVWFEVI
ncbi:MAG: hypothetical protein OEV49_05190 [candidate division Zixibacteria bacterium]|nr:hypothetical protein [candidate division Zixibacteria bacterium]MDH3939327.1 hypothetical protein [candidate division Zixibacteria bacterium]MDH4034450.1 hypothetical protein [candidate division Zixibacteria bacterium]